MSFKDWIKKKRNQIKEANKPENREKRLRERIKEEKLKAQLEKIQSNRRKLREKDGKKDNPNIMKGLLD